MDLRDTVTLITGGGTGLGRAMALGIAREGGHVAVNYSRSRAEAEATAAELRGLGVEAEAVEGDVSVEAKAVRLVEAAFERFGRLDVLVNNAGATRAVPFADLEAVTEADWDRIMGVNVKGTFFVSRAAARRLRRPGGRILTTSSIGGIRPESSGLVYSCSKAALIMLTRGLAVALAPDIQVNSIAPGLLETRWTAGFTPEAFERLGQAALLKRLPSVEDTANMALAIIKNDSITAQIVSVDGGTILY